MPDFCPNVQNPFARFLPDFCPTFARFCPILIWPSDGKYLRESLRNSDLAVMDPGRQNPFARFCLILPDFCPTAQNPFARFLPDLCPIFARFLPDFCPCRCLRLACLRLPVFLIGLHHGIQTTHQMSPDGRPAKPTGLGLGRPAAGGHASFLNKTPQFSF